MTNIKNPNRNLNQSIRAKNKSLITLNKNFRKRFTLLSQKPSIKSNLTNSFSVSLLDQIFLIIVTFFELILFC